MPATATATFAANRRVQYAPDGPVDHRVPMLRVDVGGKPKAILFSYACHNTTLPASNVEWHGDYAGRGTGSHRSGAARADGALHDRVRRRCQPEAARHARERRRQHGEALATGGAPDTMPAH